MELLNQTTIFFTHPFRQATEILSEKEPSYEKVMFSRLCFLAQIITSLIAAPILVTIGILQLVFALEFSEKSSKIFTAVWDSLKTTCLEPISISFVGSFASIETTREFAVSVNRWVAKL